MLEAFPTAREKPRKRLWPSYYVSEGTKEIMEVIFGRIRCAVSPSSPLHSACSPSPRLENADWGKNAVTSLLEHPSAHDAVEYAQENRKRIPRSSGKSGNGGIDVEEVLRHVDKDTVLVSIMAASNISGNIMDIKDLQKSA